MRFVFLAIFCIAAILTGIIAFEAKDLLHIQPFIPRSSTIEVSEAHHTASLYFAPSSLNYSSTTTPLQTELMINSGNNDISEIHAELKYNPNAISQVKVTVPDQMFLGDRENFSILFNDVNPILGRISLAIKVKPNGVPKQGIGSFANISFIPHGTTSLISFTPTSSVLAPNSRLSILEKTYNVTFTFQRPIEASPPAQITIPTLQ